MRRDALSAARRRLGISSATRNGARILRLRAPCPRLVKFRPMAIASPTLSCAWSGESAMEHSNANLFLYHDVVQGVSKLPCCSVIAFGIS